ncbi:MAG: hypothetical protein SOT68_12600, partial [Oscillospiraceae bacterium]|nr:hypothetical protein [Oscillospiraceae bacterium]
QKKAVAVQSIDNHHEREVLEHKRQLLDEREAEIAVKESESLSRLVDRSMELDQREEKIRYTEKRISEAANAVEAEKAKLHDLEAQAENKLKAAENEYNMQLELNQKYSLLQKKIRIVENDRDNKAGELANLRYAVGIDFSNKETDAVAKINAIKEENSFINMTLSKELNNVLKIVKARRNVKKIVELCDELNDSQIDTLFMCIAQMKIKKVEEECEKRKEQILLDYNAEQLFNSEKEK